VADQAFGIFLLPMERKGNTSGGIWSMAKRGNPVPITVAGSSDGFRESGAHIFASAASLFGLQSNNQIRQIVYILHA
jgi:hypothetical protein